jgi:DNA-binding NarL/FixJ family response regulator
MKSKSASVTNTPSAERFAAPHCRPMLVFSRDDAAGAAKAPAPPVSILIVEDDFLIASQIEAALVEAGFDIAGVAGSAGEALELAEARAPALAIMDIRLRGKQDGIDAALDLLKAHGVRCIFATAHSDATVQARAQPARPLGWLPKPYLMASLVEAIHKALAELQRSGN